jgi:hypothetical protein
MMAIFGIAHTRNTVVGDDFIRGVSGGEWVNQPFQVHELISAGVNE